MSNKVKHSRKTELLEKAKNLISLRGYLAMGMRELAEEAGIEAASLYSHFSSKEDILWEIAEESSDAFFEAVAPIYPKQLQTEEKLKLMIIAHVEVITAHLQASAVFFREWVHLSGTKKEVFAQKRDRYEGLFRSVVEQGIQENLFKNYDAGFSARAILSALNWTHTWYKPDGELSPVQIGEHLAGILLNGLIRTI